jgi:hypothetical protein
MKSNITRTNVTTLSAKVPQNEVNEALCAILAKQHGFSLDDAGVGYRGYHSSDDTSTGFIHSWTIEVIVDHSADPEPAVTP